MLGGCIVDLGAGFFALSSRRKGGLHLYPIFCYGPLSDTEITFLAGAVLVRENLKPKYAIGIAEENLEELKANRGRQIDEPVT